MTSHSTLTCPHCGTTNTLTTGDLPFGSKLGCSNCLRHIARWDGEHAGFQIIEQPANDDFENLFLEEESSL